MQLQAHPFFEKIPQADLDELLANCEVREFAQGKVLFKEGEETDCLYLLLEGEVSFFKTIDKTRRQEISTSVAGDFFGEIGIFTGEPRALGALAKTPVRAGRLPREDLLSYIRKTPGPIDKILQSIVGHLHHTTTHYVDDQIKTEKLAVVGNMMNSIIHDFKNPFTLISLGAQVISQMHPDENTRKLCRNIEDQIKRMVDMANEISDFSRGQTNLKFSPVNLENLIERFRDLNAPTLQRPGIHLRMQSEPVVIDAASNKLMRVLQNLVTNAIEALPGGEGSVEVQGRKIEPNKVSITVRDNGEGIPSAIREHFFEPFVTYGKSGGTGLGTAIVHSIIEAHHGSIRFDTAQGQGTIFYIELPIRQPETKKG
ncbi:MAG: ATP-binding protein [Verrucomicrobiota bacterium]